MRRLNKRAFFRRLVSFLLALAVMGPAAGTLAVPAKAAGLSLAQLQEKFPEGKYWNHPVGQPNNPDGWTNTPCTHSSHSYSGSCGCNSYRNGIQCWAFARKLANDAYNSDPLIDGWPCRKDAAYVDSIKPGDVLDNKNHTTFVVAVTATQVYVGECNYKINRGDGDCVIHWGQRAIEKSAIKRYPQLRIFVAPYELDTGTSTPTPTPPPAPVTPELTLSTSSVSLKVGQSVTIQATTKSAEAIYLDVQSANSRPFSIQRGSWNSAGTQQPLTVTGKYIGTTDLTVVMRRADTGAALASKTVKVTVLPSNAPTVTFSPADVTMDVGSAVTVNLNIKWNGARVIQLQGIDKNVCTIGSGDFVKTSSTTAALTIHGKGQGQNIISVAMLDANDKKVISYPLSVTVKAPEPDFVRAGKSAVEINVGEKVSIPVTYGIHSASSIHFTHKAENAGVCRSTVSSTSQNAATVDVYGLAPGKTKVTIAIYKTPGEVLLASTSVDVTVRQKETPPVLKVSPGTLSLGVGETKNLDLAWSGSVPSGAEIQIIASSPDIADIKMLSVNPNGSAQVAVTGRKDGTSHLNLVLCDGYGNALYSTPATVNVTAPAEKTTIRADTDQTITISTDEVRLLSFTITGGYSAVSRSYHSALTVKELNGTKGQMLYAVSADEPGTYQFSVNLLDSRSNVLGSAGYRIEVVASNPAPVVPPSDTITVSGEDTGPVKAPGDGGSSSSVSQVYPTDGNWISKIDPEESSGGGTYVVTGTRVSSSSGEVILVIPLDGKANVTTQSAGKPAVTIPADLAPSGSVEIKLPGNEALPAQSGETAGDSTLSGTVSAVLNEDGSPETGREIVASDGTVVSVDNTGNGMRFTDVSSGKYYYDAVQWAVSSGVTDGISGTTLAPDNSCPRGQVVEFMWRAMGCPEPAVKENPFTDVSAGDSYYQAALWAYGAGVTTGSTATTFSPGSTCTRGQVVTFLWRANGQPKVAGTNAFSDVSAGAYFADSVRWAVDRGITKGTTDTTFSPGNTCTRGQILTFLYRGMA